MSSETLSTYPRLIGDIGGTNARFALVPGPGMALSAPRTLACADFPGPAEAIRSYLAAVETPAPRWASIGVATPVTGDQVRMTNHHWAFSIEALRRALGLDRLALLNDFAALALALPALAPDQLAAVGGGTPSPGAPLALLGPGTGLGVAGLVRHNGLEIPIEGEGGHVTLPASTPREAEVIAVLARRYPHVSAERALSGPGLAALYQALGALSGSVLEALDAASITERGLSGHCTQCREALDLFCALLGTVAADLALTLGALGGVYIGGGIVPRFGAYFANSPFRARFERKGRFSDYLARVPVYVIQARYPGLIGAARHLERP